MAESILFDVPNLLSAGMFLAALLAAVYAERSANEARRQAKAAESSVREAQAQSVHAKAALAEAKSQNRIAVHTHQLEAYKALLQFKSRIVGSGIHFKDDAVWALWEHAQLAEFYFPTGIADSMTAVVDQALEIQASRSFWSEGAEVVPGQRQGLMAKSYDQFKGLVALIDHLVIDMRGELRIVRDEGQNQL